MISFNAKYRVQNKIDHKDPGYIRDHKSCTQEYESRLTVRHPCSYNFYALGHIFDILRQNITQKNYNIMPQNLNENISYQLAVHISCFFQL